MYESFYGFSARPFLAVPVTSRYFPASSIESARQNLVRCIERAEGCGLVMGPSGTGISLLCQVVAEHFEQQMETVLLANLRLTNSQEMLQAILYQLGIPYQKLADGELRLTLMDALSPAGRCPQGILLIVDEAHLLSPRLFEELRFMTNVVREDSPGVRLLIAGGSDLEERFAHPRLSRMNQRVAVRCYLHPFSAEESYQYIRAQTNAAGTNPDRLWAMEALRAIHRYTDGCPRLINQICNHALLLAAEAKAPQLGEREIELAWSDFQQLPTGNVTTPDTDDVSLSDGEVIEFGSLDDEPVNATSPADAEPVQAMADLNPPTCETPSTSTPDTSTLPLEPEEIHFNHSIVCQNETPEQTALSQENHDAAFDPEESPTASAHHYSEAQTTHTTGVSVTDFLGIDAQNIMQLNTGTEVTTGTEAEHVEPAAHPVTDAQHSIQNTLTETQNPFEEEGNKETGTPIWMVHQEAHTTEVNGLQAEVKKTQPLATAPVSAAKSTAVGNPHPLIPVQSQVVSELICELQETHLSKIDALKNLVQQ